MKPYFCVCALILALAAAPNCLAQNGLQSKFPSRFGSWAATTSPEKVTATEQKAALLSEAGMEEWFERTYSNGSQTLNVGLQRFRDPSGAYEIYTTALDTEMQPSTVGQLTAIGHDRLIMLVGNVVVEVKQPQIALAADLKELASAVRKFADATPLPPIRSFLPEGFSDGTQRYALGPTALRAALGALDRSDFGALVNETGFNTGAEAIAARYQTLSGNGVLLLIDYPTPQLAEQHLRHLEAAISAEAKQAGTTVERRGSLLSLVLRPSSTAFGESLRSAIRYETQVTWNEPTHKITDPPWLVVVGRIIILTLLFMGSAVAVGAAFGGLRVLLKRFFPGRIFDRPGQMEVLQLGLTGKRFDPRDFY